MSFAEYSLIEKASDQIEKLLIRLGKSKSVWGPVHGDLHHDNILFYEGQAHPIDFDGLQLAHYYYDLGVMLYHVYYQDPEIRRALLVGYECVRKLPENYQAYLEAFVIYSAINNLAWNLTIPSEKTSQLLRHQNKVNEMLIIKETPTAIIPKWPGVIRYEADIAAIRIDGVETTAILV